MTAQSRPLLAETDQPQATERSFANSVASMGRRITVWLARTAASYTAAVTYEQLWRLSDHELQRRGLSRAALAHDVGQDRNPAQAETVLNDDRNHDPMREIDMLVLEDLTMRRNLQPTRTAKTLQVTSMLLVLLGVAAIFVHALRNPGDSATIQHPSEPSSEISLIIAP